jgi:hypothetical protein
MDLIVPVLATVLPLELAGKLFLLLIFVLIAGGAAALNRVLHGRWSYWSLSVFLLLYNRTFQWGFVNYLFGVGVMLCAVALWLATAHARTWQRIASSSILALFVYFSHIIAFGAYALILTGIEAGPAIGLLRNGAWRRFIGRLAIAGAQFVVPVLFSLLSWHLSPSGGSVQWGSLWRKLGLFFTVFNSYDKAFEAVCFAGFVGTLLVLLLRRQIVLAPTMRWPLFLVTACYLALPREVLSGSGADSRLVIVLFLILLAGTVPRLASRRTAGLVGAGFILLFIARLGVFEWRWLEAGRIYQADLAAIDAMPRGARLAVANLGDAIQVDITPELHVPTLAVLRRDAFVPTLFHYPDQQPVALTPDNAALATEDTPARFWAALVEHGERPPEPVLRLLKSYDFIVFVNIEPFRVQNTACLTPVRPGTTFQLFAIDRDCAAWS